MVRIVHPRPLPGVVIGSTESTSQPLTSGVAQGSILDPLLFILYLAPLEKIIKSHGLDCIFYADDSQIYITIHYDGRDTAIAVLDQCISDIQAFFKANNLSCNPTKTDIVHFYSRFSNLSTIPSINISQHVVSVSKETRNLGLIFDSHLTMSSHINSICRSASLALRNIGRVRKYLNQANTERLVHVFISSRQTIAIACYTDYLPRRSTNSSACKTLQQGLLRNPNSVST